MCPILLVYFRSLLGPFYALKSPIISRHPEKNGSKSDSSFAKQISLLMKEWDQGFMTFFMELTAPKS